MKLYIAGPFADRALMPAIATQCEAAGHAITERWWDHEDYPGSTYPSNTDDPFYEERAVADFLGVIGADAIIVLNSSKSEGKAVETGIALPFFKPVMLVGVRTNLFHYLPNVYPVGSVEEALERLAG